MDGVREEGMEEPEACDFRGGRGGGQRFVEVFEVVALRSLGLGGSRTACGSSEPGDDGSVALASAEFPESLLPPPSTSIV